MARHVHIHFHHGARDAEEYEREALLHAVPVGPGDHAADKHIGFAKLKNELAHEKGVRDPGAVAAAIGREKYGAKAMAKKAAAGR